MWRPFNIIVSFKILRRNGSWTQAVFHCRATVRSVRGWKGLNTWCNRSCNSHMRFHMSYIYNVTLQATLKAYTSITVTPYLGLFINDYCISYCNIAELLFDRVYWRCWKHDMRFAENDMMREWEFCAGTEVSRTAIGSTNNRPPTAKAICKEWDLINDCISSKTEKTATGISCKM